MQPSLSFTDEISLKNEIKLEIDNNVFLERFNSQKSGENKLK